MFGEFSRKNQTHGRLHFSGGKCVSSRVAGESPSLGSNSLEDVVDERVHDAHGGLGDSSLGVHLSQDLVDVGGIRLGPLALPHLLGLVSTFLRSFGRRLGSLRCRGLSSFRSHLDQQAICSMMTVAVKSESFQLTLATATHFWSACWRRELASQWCAKADHS